MKRGISLLVLGLALASCGKKDAADDAPKGQVIAAVDGQEITASDLRLELPNVPLDGPSKVKVNPTYAAKQAPQRSAPAKAS